MADTTKTPEQKARDAARNKAVREAKTTMRGFFTHPLFAKLPEEVQNAAKLLAPIARQATSTAALEIKALFEKSKVISELELFKAMKIGPNEMKAKVNHCLKLASPVERMWITYDEAECTWTMVSVGAAMPKGFNPDILIPSIKERVERPEFLENTVNALIDMDKDKEAPKTEE